MKQGLIAAAAGAAMLFAVPVFATTYSEPPNAKAGTSSTASLLQKANQMNEQEIHMANLLNSKAANNQALKTLATTLKDDHMANENAVKALANQDNLNLRHYHQNQSLHNRLDNLNGATFNNAFLEHEAKDHQQALTQLKDAQSQPQNPRMKLYLDETIPVLQSHLTMIQNLQRDMAQEGSPANPANNNVSH